MVVATDAERQEVSRIHKSNLAIGHPDAQTASRALMVVGLNDLAPESGAPGDHSFITHIVLGDRSFRGVRRWQDLSSFWKVPSDDRFAERGAISRHRKQVGPSTSYQGVDVSGFRIGSARRCG